MDLGGLNFTPEQLEAAEKLVGYNWIIPKTAKVKGGRSTWMEYVSVEGAERVDEIGKNGEQRVVFRLKVKVVPGAGIESENLGRGKTDYLRLNTGTLQGRRDTVGTGDVGKETRMSAISVKRVRQIAIAAGLDLSAGLTPDIIDALFPQEGRGQSLLLGKKFAVTVLDNAGSTFNGENRQELESILAAPEGV